MDFALLASISFSIYFQTQGFVDDSLKVNWLQLYILGHTLMTLEALLMCFACPSLQIRCFDAPLQPQALQDVKRIVKKNTSAGVRADGLTLEGTFFCYVSYNHSNALFSIIGLTRSHCLHVLSSWLG